MFLEHSRMRIKESYEKVRQDLGAILDPVELVIRTLPEEEALAMRYLYAFMPYSDIANNPVETYLDFVRHGVRLYEEKEEVRELPESVYLQYVLFHRVNEEEIRPCRSLFIIRFRNRSGGNHLLKRYWKSITGVPGRWLMKRGMTAHYLRCPSGKEGTAGAERSPSLRSMS